MRKPSSILLPAILGNILEYYDFTVYSVFSSVISRAFFPEGSQQKHILWTLIIFTIGVLARPIGGIFFGFIGDRYGRRLALTMAMSGMTLSTLLMGCMPTYEDMGIYAPALLLGLRLLQGLSISGESVGTAIYILEHYRHVKPGFTAGLVNASNLVGTLLASFVGILAEQYPIAFAWRLAFLLGGLMGLAGFFLRLKIVETPVFKQLMEQKKTLKDPFRVVVRTAWKAMFITFCVGSMASSIVYLVKSYTNVYYHTVLKLDNTIALSYLFYVSFISMLSMPLFGRLADRIGPFKTIVRASIALCLLILPTLVYMTHFISIVHQIIGLTVLGMLSGVMGGVAYFFVLSLFKPEQKFSGASFSYNLGIALFGGSTPPISHWLITQTKLQFAPAFYIMLLAVLFLLSLYLMRSTVNSLMKNATS
ncbi:MAG: MFS transporter [Candidatus Cardinium sp.]|nr:MFS transporter [Candidatus Cardinium sp.]